MESNALGGKKQSYPYTGMGFKLPTINQEGVWELSWAGPLNKSVQYLNVVKEPSKCYLERKWEQARKLYKYMTSLQVKYCILFFFKSFSLDHNVDKSFTWNVLNINIVLQLDHISFLLSSAVGWVMEDGNVRLRFFFFLPIYVGFFTFVFLMFCLNIYGSLNLLLCDTVYFLQ